MKNAEDIPFKFWKEYESSDMLDREKKLKPIINMIDKLHDIKDEKLRKHTLAIGLQGYFDDLIDYMSEAERRNKMRKRER